MPPETVVENIQSAAEPVAAPVAPAAAPVAPATGDDSSGDEGRDARFARALSELAKTPVDGENEEEAKEEGSEPNPKAEPEKPAEPKPEPPPDEAELSKAFAALKHKTKRFEDRIAEHAASVAAFETKQKEAEAAHAAREQEWNERKVLAAKNPAEALKQLGWTVEQFLKYVADGGEVPQDKIYEGLREEMRGELKKTQDEVAAERAKLEDFHKQQAQAKAAGEARAYEVEVGNEIVDVLGSEAPKFKYLGRVVRKNPALVHRGVLNKIAGHYTKEKKVLAVSDAMLQLEAEAKADAELLLEEGSDARQAGAVQPAVQPGNSQQPIEPIPSRETARRGVTTEVDPSELSRDERLALALRQAKGEA